ncbi:MAG: YggT family protein [Candidatus Limnocylindria bacterium]
MTHDRRNDPVEPGPVDPVDNETRVVERQAYVERERPAAEPHPAPAQPAGSQVNVNSGDRAYVDTAAPGPLYYVRRILSLLFGILAVLLGLRILLLLLVANQGNTIVDFVFSVTEPFVVPFRGVFAINEVRAGEAALDVAALVALVGWLLIYLLLMAILRLGDRDRVSVA